MTTTTTKREYTIDATDKRLGIVATEAAKVLLGKTEPDFTKHLVAPVTVTIQNASKLDITEKKKKDEVYQTYSGYPGGLRSETLGHLGDRRGYAEVLRRTIGGMLPNNKLKKLMLKNLVITE
jgi:large subunit ribosomal protein L13